jgi:hypothetical protein
MFPMRLINYGINVSSEFYFLCRLNNNGFRIFKIDEFWLDFIIKLIDISVIVNILASC